jgi:hypothetical protein
LTIGCAAASAYLPPAFGAFGADVETPMGSVIGSSNLNVSPYLASAMSRIQANAQAAAPKSPAQAPASSGTTQVLSDRTLGALVALQANKP